MTLLFISWTDIMGNKKNSVVRCTATMGLNDDILLFFERIWCGLTTILFVCCTFMKGNNDNLFVHITELSAVKHIYCSLQSYDEIYWHFIYICTDMMGIIDTFELPCIDMMVITTIWVIPYSIMVGNVDKLKIFCNDMLDYNENLGRICIDLGEILHIWIFFALMWSGLMKFWLFLTIIR